MLTMKCRMKMNTFGVLFAPVMNNLLIIFMPSYNILPATSVYSVILLPLCMKAFSMI